MKKEHTFVIELNSEEEDFSEDYDWLKHNLEMLKHAARLKRCNIDYSIGLDRNQYGEILCKFEVTVKEA